MQRSLLLFLESVKSQASQKQYQYYLNKFMERFGYGTDYDKLAHTDPKQIQENVEDYVMWLKRKVNPNSVPSYVYPIQAFMESNEIDLRWKKIRRLFPANIRKGGKSAYNTEQIRTLLDAVPDLRGKLVIHVLASTGCRIGALKDLSVEHLTRFPENYTAIRFYNDDVEEYHSFLTPEATQVLDRYFNQRTNDHEELTPHSPVFRSKYKIGGEPVKPMTQRAFDQVVVRALKKSGLRSPQEKKRGRYDIPMNHGFRKRFITILKSYEKIPVAYSERLAGHMVYTDEYNNKIQLDDSYLRPELDKLLSFFKLAAPELTIDQTEKSKQILDTQQEKIDEISKLKRQFENFKKESQNEIEKLKYFNEVSSAYLHRGEFPKIEKRGDKKVFKYKSLDELEKPEETDSQ